MSKSESWMDRARAAFITKRERVQSDDWIDFDVWYLFGLPVYQRPHKNAQNDWIVQGPDGKKFYMPHSQVVMTKQIRVTLYVLLGLLVVFIALSLLIVTNTGIVGNTLACALQ